VRRSREAPKGAYRGEDRNSATMEDVVALVDGPRPVGEDQRRNAGSLIMAVWRWVLRALRIVMMWFMVAFVLAFILIAVVIQRIASWARGLLRSNMRHYPRPA
jgi:hypothetical protein